MKFGKMVVVVAALGLGQAAMAQGVDGAAAGQALFSPKDVGVEVVKHGFLLQEQLQILASVAADQPYYGAIAVSPDEGLMSEATVAAANYHSVEAASAAALGGCDAARKGAGACVIVAYIRPKGWQARSVQLSADATRAFSKDYGGKGAALAVSAGTGTWAMAKGATASEAAIAACGAKLTGPNDCTVVIAD